MYKKKWVAYLFITPMLIFFIIFLFYPFLVNVYNSFFDYESILDKNPRYIGFDNYLTMFTDVFQRSLINTLILIGLVLIFQVGVALILALLVNSIQSSWIL